MTKHHKSALRRRALSKYGDEEAQKNAIIRSCTNAWDHLHLPSTGSASEKHMENLVAEAAEDAVLIKTNLERTRQSGTSIRLVHGGAAEYLRNLETFPSDRSTFIRELVHAVFKNSKGHVCEITPQDIDSRLDILLGKRKAAEQGGFQTQDEIAGLERKLKETWVQTSEEAKQIFMLIEENSFYTADYGAQLSKVLTTLQSTRHHLGVFHEILKKAQVDEHAEEMEEAPVEQVLEDNRIPPERPSTPPLEMEEEEKEEKEERKGEEEKIEKEEEEMQENEEPSLPNLSPVESGRFESTMEKVSGEVENLKGKTLALENLVDEVTPERLGSTNMKEGKKILDQIQHAWALLSESLNRNLVTLDELVVGPAERPRRKELVTTIQDITEHLESFAQKIQKLTEAHKAREAEEKDKQRKLQEEKQQQTRQATTSMEVEENQATQQPVAEGSKLQRFEENLSRKIKRESDAQLHLEEFKKELARQAERLEPVWRKLKLNPKIVVEEEEEAYIISAYIPGMKKQDVEILATTGIHSPTLSLRGHRSPNYEEIALMRRQLVRAGVEPEDNAMVRLGTGRFGSFAEKYAIPKEVDVNEIAGSYEEGELVVRLPKLRLLEIPRSYQGYQGYQDWW